MIKDTGIKIKNQRRMELLAPAGDWDALLAGLAGGADAVYLGGKAFSARQSAANFDLSQIKEATDLLHLHQKKIYVTVNTLIADDEIENALDYLADLYNLGIDAVIVQDLGLIKLTREYIPNLELHASTQMTVHNHEGALFLKEMGIKRVVLARELTESEIKSISELTQMETEVFVHGALCLCYSGQCLMSSMIGGRSGNRGRCAQPCRLEYQLLRDGSLVENNGSYLLSPQDLSLIELLPQLDRAGVTSLKIEGRMKRPEYVFTVTKNYRKALDRYYHSPDDFKPEPGEIEELERVFNRGYTTGYFGGNRNRMLMSFNRPNNRGQFLGRIKTYDPRTKKIRLKLESDLQVGDEVEIWVTQGGRLALKIDSIYIQGRRVESAEAGVMVEIKGEGKLSSGSRVFKVFSIRTHLETKEALKKDRFQLPCTVQVDGIIDEPLRVIYRDELGHESIGLSQIPLQWARNRPLTMEVLTEQLGRLGDSPFFLEKIDSSLPDGLMLPVSELNRIRREAVEQLIELRLKSYRRKPVRVFFSDRADDPTDSMGKRSRALMLSVTVDSLEGAIEASLAGADIIYAGGEEFSGFHWDINSYRRAIAAARESGARLVMVMPRINREGQRQLWQPCLQNILQSDPDGVLVSDLGTLNILLKESTSLPIYLNFPLNFFNHYAAKLFSNDRIQQITLSPELTLTQVAELRNKAAKPLECIIHGPLELMISEYCPIASVGKESGEDLDSQKQCNRQCRKNQFHLRDRLKIDFPIYTDQFCRMHLLNSQDLCLYADLTKFSKIAPLTLRLDLKTYTASQIAIITNAYRFALNRLAENGDLPDTEEVISSFKAISGRGITRGHYFRGVE